MIKSAGIVSALTYMLVRLKANDAGISELNKERSEHMAESCPLGSIGSGSPFQNSPNQYVQNQYSYGGPNPQMAGQGSFGMIDANAISAAIAQGKMRQNPNIFYGSQFINQVQQCPGPNCPMTPISIPRQSAMQPSNEDLQQPTGQGTTDQIGQQPLETDQMQSQEPPVEPQSQNYKTTQQRPNFGCFRFPAGINSQAYDFMMQQQQQQMMFGYPYANVSPGIYTGFPVQAPMYQSNPFSCPYSMPYSCGSSVNQVIYG